MTARVCLISAIAEAVGAVGVIAGLIYVAVQIRHNTRSMRISTFTSANRGVHRTLIGNSELLRVYLAGQKGFNDLSPEDRLRFHGLMLDWVLEYQLFKQSFDEGAQSGESFAGRSLGEFEKHIISLLRTPGGQAWWQGETYLNPDTRAEIDRLMAEHPEVRFRQGDPYLGPRDDGDDQTQD